MARTKKNRLIQMAPHFNGFKPQGLHHKSNSEVVINFEEYEALKLCDYELFTQAEAAALMNISRPTFTRIYESVRRKIAKAFIEGSPIVFEGGNVNVIQWYKCSECDIAFTLTDDTNPHCPLCQSKTITLNS
ncbi:DUF134 domain-containing protein [uncultured Bacteroides sp.]|uniref:DUF134 domain-containing protein n=1 Tax=uncultured Bacteroides sp. TaxID=162156 RepID=UPI002AABBE2E|nr:DUF134 domain-containing protein [uncultured Bacteroides sp.]